MICYKEHKKRKTPKFCVSYILNDCTSPPLWTVIKNHINLDPAVFMMQKPNPKKKAPRPAPVRKRKSGSGKRASHFWRIFAGIVLAMLVFSVVRYFITIHQNKDAYFAHYKEFGIDIPENFHIHGIDVSHHQGKINWSMVKSMESQDIRIGFAFIKATEGVNMVDENFLYNWVESGLMAIPHGAYHFFIPGKSGRLQAENYMRQVLLSPGCLPPVADIEQLYGVPVEKMRQELKEFLQILQAHYQVKPIIYTYASFYTDYLEGYFDDYTLWVAHYFENKHPRIDRPWRFWQHSELAHVYGIRHKVDFNVFNGDSTAFQNVLIPPTPKK